MDHATIGNRIRALRMKQNLTQDGLATLLGVSRVQVNQWETGAREVSASRIVRLAEIFDTSCDYLMRGLPSQELCHVPSEDFTDLRAETHVSPDVSTLGLSAESMNALQDLADMDHRKRDQYYEILNGLLGSNSFWQMLMPAAAAAYTIKEQAALGGTESTGAISLPNDLENQLKSSIEILKLGNAAGYMDNLLISKDKAYAFQISEATHAFQSLLKAIIEKKAHPIDKETEQWTAPYQSIDRDHDRVAEFRKFFAMFGLSISADNI